MGSSVACLSKVRLQSVLSHHVAECQSIVLPVQALLRDWKLRGLMFFFQISVVVYVCVRSMVYWTIIEYEDIEANFNMWTNSLWNVNNSTRLTAQYCTRNQSFDFVPADVRITGGIQAYNHTCPYLTAHDVFKIVGDEAHITLWQQRHAPGCSFLDSYCARSEFIHGVEDLPIFIIHTVSAPRNGFSSHNMRCQIKSPDGEESYDEVNTTVMKGNGWKTSLRQLMHYAGVATLDQEVIDNTIETNGSSILRMRLAGFVLVMHFKYENYQPWLLTWHPGRAECELRVEVQKQAWGYFGAHNAINGEQVQRAGARIKLTATGQYGRIDVKLLVSTFVEGVVLLGIAGAITFQAAKLLYGSALRDVTEIDITVTKSANGTSKFASVSRTSQLTLASDTGSRSDLMPPYGNHPSPNGQEWPSSTTNDGPAQRRPVLGLLAQWVAQETLWSSLSGESLLEAYVKHRIAGHGHFGSVHLLCLTVGLNETEVSASLWDAVETLLHTEQMPEGYRELLLQVQFCCKLPTIVKRMSI